MDLPSTNPSLGRILHEESKVYRKAAFSQVPVAFTWKRWLLLSLPYTFCITLDTGRGRIWVVWQAERVEKGVGSDEPSRLDYQECFEPLGDTGLKLLKRDVSCLVRAYGYGLYFSLIAAFTIGWRDLNAGNWISRVQGREYTLKSTGWVRTLAGLQSIASAYLLALSVLCYFGRPFE